MKESFQAKLWVNEKDIALNPFLEQFVAGMVTGGVRTLKGVEEVRTVELKIVRKAVTLAVNGKALDVNQFLNDILVTTLGGAVSPLKGVGGEVDRLQLDIKVVQKKA